MTTLYRVPLGTLSLMEALGEVPGTGMIALFYPGQPRIGDDPRECRFARVEGGMLIGPDNRMIGLGNIYEARAFNKDLELRWLQTTGAGGEPRGTAVILHEGAPGLDRNDGRAVIDTGQQHYVLWGRSDGEHKNGWSRLVAARIGELWVPIELAGANRFARLDAREYFETSLDGNVIVGEERLIGLSSYGEVRNG